MFNIREFNNWQEVFFRASTEISANELLHVRKFAHSAGLTADVSQDIWGKGGTQTLVTSAGTVSCVSSSVNDAVNGTGAWYVLLVGLDANYDTISETVTLTGTTPAVSTKSFLRVNTTRTTYHGSTKCNVGNITCSIGETVANYIEAAEGVDHSSHYTIPAGYTGFVQSIYLTAYRTSGGAGAVRRVEVDQIIYLPEINAQYKTLRYGITSDGGPYSNQSQVPSQTPAKSTLWFAAIADTNNTAITSGMSIVLIKENLNFRLEV